MAFKRPVGSTAWNYFHKDDDEFATCLVTGCKAKIKHSRNTSNLLKHLKSRHLQQHQECLEERRLHNEKTGKKSKDASLAGSSQPTLNQVMASSCFYPKESVKRQRIEEALVEMITTDLQPSSIVEDSGFKKFVRTLDPQYEMPSRRTIMRKILPAKYEEVRESLHNEINHATHLAITTDIWTSCQRQGPIVVLQPTS